MNWIQCDWENKTHNTHEQRTNRINDSKVKLCEQQSKITREKERERNNKIRSTTKLRQNDLSDHHITFAHCTFTCITYKPILHRRIRRP